MVIVIWLAFFFPDFSAPTVFAGIVATATAAITFRLMTPFMLWGHQIAIQMKEIQRARDERRKRDSL